MSEYFNTDHHEIIVEPDSVNLLEKMIWYSDEPLVDFAMIPLYIMSQKAKKDVTVVLTGEGGDETQAGYVHYLSHQKLKSWGKYMPIHLRVKLPPLITKMLPNSWLKYHINYAMSLWKNPEAYVTYTPVFSENDKEDLYTSELLKNIKPITSDQITSMNCFQNNYDFLNQMLLTDINTLLANSYLVKTDRATMAASIEARVPLLDHKLVEFTFEIPPQSKIRGNTTKYIFRKAVKDILPETILKRKKRVLVSLLIHGYRRTRIIS